jgi:hypothetical protein
MRDPTRHNKPGHCCDQRNRIKNNLAISNLISPLPLPMVHGNVAHHSCDLHNPLWFARSISQPFLPRINPDSCKSNWRHFYFFRPREVLLKIIPFLVTYPRPLMLGLFHTSQDFKSNLCRQSRRSRVRAPVWPGTFLRKNINILCPLSAIIYLIISSVWSHSVVKFDF